MEERRGEMKIIEKRRKVKWRKGEVKTACDPYPVYSPPNLTLSWAGEHTQHFH